MKQKYIHSLLAIILVLLSCEKTSDTIIDTIGILPPMLSQLTLSPDRINSDTIAVGYQPSPTDTLPINVISTVRASAQEGAGSVQQIVAQVFRPGESEPFLQQAMQDNGVLPDVVGGDGIYSAKISFRILRQETGKFRFEFQAASVSDVLSNKLITYLLIERLNKPPVLSDLQAPDTVAVSTSTVFITLSVKASDPDGLQDIARVQFNSFKPDGSPSSGNPFQMYDDGKSEHGDSVVGDGIYSLIIQLPPGTTKGTYRFEFQAFDKSNAGSNIMVHKMVVQ